MLCLLARVDASARQRLLQLQRIATDMGIAPRGLHGHVTLVTYVGADEAAFIASCKEHLAQQRAFCICYEKVVLLSATAVIAAAPACIGTLAAVQQAMALPWSDALNQWTRPGAWTPHTTLVHSPGADLAPIAQAMQAAFAPFCARVERMEFSRVTAEGYEIVDAIELL